MVSFILLALGGLTGFYAMLHYRLGHPGLPFAPAAVAACAVP